jgi:hypothetical protein
MPIDETKNTEPEKIKTPSYGNMSNPERWKNFYFVLYYLFLFIICPTVFFYCLDNGMGGFGIFIFLVPVSIIMWCYAKGIWKFPTKEEKEAMREESMRKWGTVKSAHIIRLERGLYTGLGNRRPYPHGRRTKKY